MQPAVGRAGEDEVGAFSGRAWGEVDPSILFLWGPQCVCLRAQVTCSCLILGKGIIEREPGGGKSSGMNQAGNPVKAAESVKPVGSNEAARGLCSLGCRGALLMWGGSIPRKNSLLLNKG